MDKLSEKEEQFKASVLRRAFEISHCVDRVTLGVNASTLINTSNENIENSQNNININEPNRVFPISTSKAKSRISFSREKIHHENEMQRREEVRKAVEQRKQDMVSFREKLYEKTALMKQELELKYEKEMAEEKARLEAEEEQAAQEFREKLAKEAQEYDKHKQHQEAMEKILGLRLNFTEKCTEMTHLAKTIKNKNLVVQLMTPFAAKLQELNQQLEALSENEKTDRLTNDDVTSAYEIINQTEEIYNVCRVDVNKANDIYDEELRKEQEIQAEQQAQADLIKDAQNSAPPECEPPKSDLPANEVIDLSVQTSSAEIQQNQVTSVEMEARRIYLNGRTYLEQYRGALKPYIDSNNSPKFLNECNKTITFLIKNISPTSGTHLISVIEDFKLLFEGKSPPHVTQSPQGLAFYRNLTAESFIDQVEESFLGRNPKWIYAVASVIVALWAQYPDFGQIFLAHLRIRCPYVIPVLLPPLPGQSVEDFYGSRGYRCENGKLEDDKQFIQRMSNIIKLYAAIIVTRLNKNMIQSHPHGLGNAWRWLATLLNSEPTKDAVITSARLIKDMLEVVGNAMWTCYPTQFPKLLMVLAQDYYSLLLRHESQNNCEMSLLKDFLFTVITQKQIPPPEGLLPANFW